MTGPNHTPGPWRAVPRSSICDTPSEGKDGLGWDIEGPPEPMLRGQFAKGADARLVAAAPAMFDALRRIEAECQEPVNIPESDVDILAAQLRVPVIQEMARYALTLAKGEEPNIPLEWSGPDGGREGIIQRIKQERDRQDSVWGSIATRELTDYECLAILMEEVGECARSLNDVEPPKRTQEELVQVMAAALLWAETVAHRLAETETDDEPK